MKKLILISKETKTDLGTISINEEDIAMDFFDGINNEKFEKTTNKIFIRGLGEFVGRSLWLNPDYDYILGIDSMEVTILIPLKKK